MPNLGRHHHASVHRFGHDQTFAPAEGHGEDLLHEILVLGTPHGERLLRFTNGEITIGRGLECDVVINTQYTSRVHARILRSGGRFFFLEDCSRNGTFVSLRGTNAVLVRHGERVPLIGYGIIGLGVRPAMNALGTLRFSLVRSALP